MDSVCGICRTRENWIMAWLAMAAFLFPAMVGPHVLIISFKPAQKMNLFREK